VAELPSGGGAGEEAADLRVGHEAVEAVGAEQEPISDGEGEGGWEIRPGRGLLAHGLEEDISFRVLEGLFFAQVPVLDQATDDGVIPGQAEEAVAPGEIGPAIAHVGEVQGGTGGIDDGEEGGGSHSLSIGHLSYGLMGLGDSPGEGGSPVFSGPAPAERAEPGPHHELGRFPPPGMASHAIGEEGEHLATVLSEGESGVLVRFPDGTADGDGFEVEAPRAGLRAGRSPKRIGLAPEIVHRGALRIHHRRDPAPGRSKTQTRRVGGC